MPKDGSGGEKVYFSVWLPYYMSKSRAGVRGRKGEAGGAGGKWKGKWECFNHLIHIFNQLWRKRGHKAETVIACFYILGLGLVQPPYI